MLELRVEGMTCGHCEHAVRTALEGVPGVASVKVSQPDGKAWVEGDADLRSLLAAVAEEGYRASPVVGSGGAR